MGDWRESEFKSDWANVLQSKERKPLIYRDQAELTKPYSDDNDPVHMSVHNDSVVMIILTSEAKTFKAWILFKSVTHVPIGSLQIVSLYSQIAVKRSEL